MHSLRRRLQPVESALFFLSRYLSTSPFDRVSFSQAISIKGSAIGVKRAIVEAEAEEAMLRASANAKEFGVNTGQTEEVESRCLPHH